MKLHLHLGIVEQLREMLHAQPFERFKLRLHSGEVLNISHPDFLTVTVSGRIIYDAGKGFRMLNETLIASIDEIHRRRKAS